MPSLSSPAGSDEPGAGTGSPRRGDAAADDDAAELPARAESAGPVSPPAPPEPPAPPVFRQPVDAAADGLASTRPSDEVRAAGEEPAGGEAAGERVTGEPAAAEQTAHEQPAHEQLADEKTAGPAGAEHTAAEHTAPERAGDGQTAHDHPAAEQEIDWEQLPEPIRARLAEVAAAALGGLTPAEVPRPLRPVAKFTPGKRARFGRGPLLAELRTSTAFRSAVLVWAGQHHPASIDLESDDPVTRAVAALLAGDERSARWVRVVARRAEDAQLRSERDVAVTRAERMAAELDRLRAENGAARAAVELARTESEAELDRLRRRLREQGVRLRQAKDAAAAALLEAEQARAAAEEAVRELTEQRDRERDRAEAERARARRALADVEIARQSAREARQADEVRLALLVDTLGGAVTGLRRELGIGGGSGPRPADLVSGASVSQGMGARVTDSAALDRLLALPAVHLVVDGYNVTKTGYPELTLAAQRERLAQQLGALAARTGAEVTVVFDGADVVSVPTVVSRGTRVLFSDPGVLADDVIRALVAAEPEGRPVVVATSDRAVADSVRRRGAHPVASAVLLARLGRI